MKISPEAEWEIAEIIRWYEYRVEGLGFKFLSRLDEVFVRICSHPQSGKLIEETFRVTCLKGFLYNVIYKSEMIVVYSVFHQKRGPLFLRKKITT